MKITWLGQAGLLMEIEKLKIMIDPYLSDSVEKMNPQNYRRVAVQESIFDIQPDVMIFTHSHLDHYDPETVGRFLTKDTNRLVLSPSSVWKEVRLIGGENNYVQFNRGTSWSVCGVRFTAVKAEHSDEYAIGVLVEADGKTYYITGDTLYNEEIFKDIPEDIYAVFLPVNGVGNNMNMDDAARFAKNIHAQKVVPVHVGMFDELKPEDFECEGRMILKMYQEIEM